MYLTQSLHRSLQQQPERTAVLFSDRRRSFREFGDRVARLAGALQRLDMQAGERVAILAMNSDRYLELQMAIPWGGGVAVPCNVRWSPAEILHSLKDSGTTILAVDEALFPVFERLRHELTGLQAIVYSADGAVPAGALGHDELIAANAPVLDVRRGGTDLAGIFYTGGTTGSPKGVMLSHANLCSSAVALMGEGVATRGGTYLHVAPMFHLADFGIANAYWIAGCAHAAVPAFDPAGVLRAIARYGVSDMLLVPTMIQMLVDHMAKEPAADISTLKRIVYGASPIVESLLNRALLAFPGVELVQAYGMTELSPIATIHPAFYHRRENHALGKLRSAGRASYCMEVRVVDAADNEVARGTVGEVVVRGPNVMLGYWNMPEATAAAIRDGWMHTGDGGYMDDEGFIYIVDRIKDMIITGGENVYSAEVENALARHPAVASCAVIGIPSDEWGETVHASVVLRPGQPATADELIAHCRELIAHYKCPRRVDFVDALPLSGAGKILKNKLREQFWQGRSRSVS